MYAVSKKEGSQVLCLSALYSGYVCVVGTITVYAWIRLDNWYNGNGPFFEYSNSVDEPMRDVEDVFQNGGVRCSLFLAKEVGTCFFFHASELSNLTLLHYTQS